MQKLTEAALPSPRKSEPDAPVADLRDWLSRVQTLGELIRVSSPVDRDEEMSAISYLIVKQHPSLAVLFDRIVVQKYHQFG